MAVKLHATGKSKLQTLPASDRGRVLSWLMDFAEEPRGSGHKLHRVDSSPGLWTARISDDYRAVLAQDGDDWYVLHIGHHDPAYRWAEKRRVQIDDDAVSIEFSVDGFSETDVQNGPTASVGVAVEEPVLPEAVLSDAALTEWGCAPHQIAILRRISDVDTLLEFATSLPEALSDRLLGVAAGEPVGDVADARSEGEEPEPKRTSAKLDIRRTYYIVDGNEDLARVIDKPLAAWVAFLHPSQHRIAYGTFAGPVKVSGGAGTGKTVVALHRARHLSRQGKRVLLVSYVSTLVENIQSQLRELCTDDERSRITVNTVHSTAMQIARAAGRKVKVDNEGRTEKWLREVADRRDSTRSPDWYVMEWEHVIQAQGIRTRDDYLAASRAGRGTPLRADERREVWAVFEEVLGALEREGITDWTALCMIAREALESGSANSHFDVVICDEMQDLRPQELRFLACVAKETQDGFTVVGDASQRIYAPKFSLRSAGIDVVGRSFVLRVNYRTTRQIKELAEKVLAPDAPADGALSVYSGPSPQAISFERHAQEASTIAQTIDGMMESGSFTPDDIAVFARSGQYLNAVEGQLNACGLRFCRLSRENPLPGCVRTATMHRAKGLEYKAVFVIGVSKEVLPEPKAIAGLKDPQALSEAMEQERQLLYVAMTRARDELWVTWVGEPSEFLDVS